MRRVEGFLEFHKSNTKLVEYFLFKTGENQSASYGSWTFNKLAFKVLWHQIFNNFQVAPKVIDTKYSTQWPYLLSISIIK